MLDDNEMDFDEFAFYDEQFSQTARERKRAKRSPSARSTRAAEVTTLAEATDTKATRTMTYVPARFEAAWLPASLESFYEDELIGDVLAIVKGGKEANVYRCRALPSTGETLLAAKVYRPRGLRNLGNNSMYRDGRTILTPDGRAVKRSDHRLMRAIGKKTAFGKQVANTSWLMHEFTTLQLLHALGAAVPKPFAANENALLMGYYGDAQAAAPTLSGVRLPRDEAEALFADVLRTVELMLAQGLIHGDLSAYNILYWQGSVTLIDFPQITDAATNRNAQAIFERDVTRVCQYFAAQGVTVEPARLAADLWARYAALDLDDALADASRQEEEP